jgi:1-acyl-sn-glycerol-3-phosphate acyltransferase
MRYVIAANHQSTLDAFIMMSGFTPVIYRHIRPIRSMLKNRYLNGGLVTSYLLGMGCFPAKAHSMMPYGLDLSIQLLNRGQAIFICPEGGLTLPGEAKPHRGVTVLAKEPGVRIIPTHIQWTRYGRWRRTFKLTYGMPFDGSDMTAQEIMDRIYAVPLS